MLIVLTLVTDNIVKCKLTWLISNVSVLWSSWSAGLVAVGAGDGMLRVWKQNNALNSYDVQTFWQGIKSKVTAVSFADVFSS